jgi:hypothetical protein
MVSKPKTVAVLTWVPAVGFGPAEVAGGSVGKRLRRG